MKASQTFQELDSLDLKALPEIARDFFSGNVWKGCLIRYAYAKTSGREARFSVTSKNWTEFSNPPPPAPPASGLEKDVFEAQSTFEYLTLARERRFS